MHSVKATLISGIQMPFQVAYINIKMDRVTASISYPYLSSKSH